MKKFKAWVSRIKIYMNERYFPVPYLFACVVTSFALWSVVGEAVGFKNVLSTNVWLVGFNLFVFPLVMRICDEYKDLEADRKHFPERCIPRGAVKMEDIAILGKGLFVLFLILNSAILFSQGRSFTILIALIVYLWLFLKYFYFPRFVSGSLMAALFLSNPITWVLAAYNASLLFPESEIYSKSFVLISVLFWIPSWVWEVARKVRLPEEETAYDTYSKVLGLKAAALLPVLGIGMMIGILIELAKDFPYSAWIQAAGMTLLLCYLAFMLIFSFSKIIKSSKSVRPVTELFILLISLAELSFFLTEIQ